MHSALPALIAGIDADDGEALLGAGELLRACRIGVGGTSPIEPYGSIFAAEPLAAEDVGALRNALMAYAMTPGGRHLPSAFHALGELKDEALVPFFREQLELHLHRLMEAKSVVGQLIVGLNDLGEGLFERSFSATDIDQNVGSAMRYLHKHGRIVPW